MPGSVFLDSAGAGNVVSFAWVSIAGASVSWEGDS